ncbi:MAG: DinB family protein [Gemmatimonadales bacterium]
MDFDLQSGVALLSRTPAVLDVWLRDLPDVWTTGADGPDTWSPYDVVGHLIHGERTDWVPRVEHIRAHGEELPLAVFNRFAQYQASRDRTLPELLDIFRDLRAESLNQLADLQLTAADLDRTGQHPEFGRVTLRQHLATWVAHDMNHISQIARVMGRQYTDAVGPWRKYLRIVGPA